MIKFRKSPKECEVMKIGKDMDRWKEGQSTQMILKITIKSDLKRL